MPFFIKKPAELKVIVTGTPRTGTSFLSGLVHRMGFSLGPKKWLKKADKNNVYGYFECVPLLQISDRILEKLGGSFLDLPEFKPGWTALLEEEKREILRIVQKGGIELYKGNRLTVLAGLYDEIFPDAQWIYISRDINETYKSRFGGEISFEDWRKITNRRISLWESSRPATKALNLDYRDFKDNSKATVYKILDFLGLNLSSRKIEECINFFQTRH